MANSFYLLQSETRLFHVDGTQILDLMSVVSNSGEQVDRNPPLRQDA